MRAIAGGAEGRRAVLRWTVISVATIAALVVAAVTPLPIGKLVPLLAVVVLAASLYRTLLLWQSLIAAMVLVILWIPIRRYELPVNLPFELEPYRIFVMLVAGAWLSSLLVDPRVRLRRSVFDVQIAAVVIAVVLSDAVSGNRIAELAVSAVVIKKLSFLVSFVVVFYMIVSLVRRHEHLQFLVKTLVAGGAVVAAFALVEARTGYNVFNHLQGKIPGLRLHTEIGFGHGLDRGGKSRVFGSAQHPIALGAALVVLLPLSVYLVRETQRRRWWIAGALLACGAVATVSRTSIVMLLVALLVFVRHRGKELKRFWPALIPFVVVVHLAAPGAIGGLRESFFPKNGLVAEQKVAAGTVGSGRVADLGPTLGQWSQFPVFGRGYGTRVVDGKTANAMILDDEWLGTLLETGLLGVLTWLWLYRSAIRRLSKAARGDPTPRGWLFTAIEASIASFAVGMLFYDAFSFIQVTFLLFILLALGSTALLEPAAERVTAPTREPRGHGAGMRARTVPRHA